jgi:hypothetical protein
MIDEKSTNGRILCRQKKIFALLTLLGVLTILPGPRFGGTLRSSEAHESSDRSQSMLINLKSAPMSAGYYLLHSYSNSKVMTRDLAKALNQVVEVDKTYAKSRNKPDSRYLEDACLRITVARQTAEQLQDQLRDAYSSLKSSIEETVITDPHFK